MATTRTPRAMRLCLNMIVRNESAILERCLRSVRDHVDCYVVADTGSTDGTVDLVGRVLAGLPGEVHSLEFRDFGQARNGALELARRSPLAFDYLLLIDADMELVVERAGWRDRLTHSAYLLRQVSGGMAYLNVRLLRRDAPARYVGAAHEFLDLGAPARRLEGLHMLDHACGSSRAVKGPRDLALLASAVERNPEDARSVFYLAQTLREAGRHAEALAMYERRISLGGFEEEVWYSQFMIARCHQAMGDAPRFLAACLEAYDLRPSRAEPLHAMAEHHRLLGRNEACAMLCEVGLRIPIPEDLLFVQEDVYRHGFRQEMSITGYYSRDPARRALARRFCEELAVDRGAPPPVRHLARDNWRHYARSAPDLFGSAEFVPLQVPLPEGYHPCNPSVAVRDREVWCVLRSVNYLVRHLEYLVADGGAVRNQNYLLRLDGDLRPRSPVPVVETAPARAPSPAIVGLEDIRLFFAGGRWRGSATVADRTPDGRRQMAVFDLGEEGRVEGLSFQEHGADQHQKNWVPFVDRRGLGFIYRTDPTTVLRWDEGLRQALPWRHLDCPLALEHLRGGSGAIPFAGGWLYLAHEVGLRGGRRTYLHRFVHLDRTFRVRAVTEPFYFRHLGVEFCCGLAAPEEGRLLASFGVEDREAWLVVLDAGQVRRALRPAR